MTNFDHEVSSNAELARGGALNSKLAWRLYDHICSRFVLKGGIGVGTKYLILIRAVEVRGTLLIMFTLVTVLVPQALPGRGRKAIPAEPLELLGGQSAPKFEARCAA